MFDIKCPECASIGKMSLIQSIYQGPYRCWKCRALFQVKIENNEMKSCQPLSEEEYQKLEAQRQDKSSWERR